MRQKLGFDYFYVGRDHAGAEKLYKDDSAIKTVKKFKKNLKLNLSFQRAVSIVEIATNM